MSLQNIGNIKRDIYLFLREDNGSQTIKKISDFFPFFYEPDTKGSFKGYDGTTLKRVFASNPGDIPQMRSPVSYSADIKFTTNFMVNRVESIGKGPIKYTFIDIEIKAEDLPDMRNPKYPVSCITSYNSLNNKITTFFLNDYATEKEMLEAFVGYMQKERFDVWLSWNSSFDYNYLYYRYRDFAKAISPIHSARVGEDREIFYPAGLSIVDYLKLFKKVYMREASYTLDYIGEKFVNRGKKYKNVDFSKITEEVKLRNIDDVQIMIELEKQLNLISYYDEIRRLTKCQWEDLIYNSRIVEMLLLEEAKNKKVILPNKPVANENDETTFQGATRDIEKAGVYKEIGKFDLGSAYPTMIVEFCLDSSNIKARMEDNTIQINDLFFTQSREALLPSIVKKILTIKDSLKKQKKDNPDSKDIATKYDAIKAIVNSAFGVMGNQYFRIYDNNVASTITFLVRDLLMYVKERVEKEGYRVLYWDTDSVFLNTKENISNQLNQFIKDWALEKFGKKEINLSFDYEGYFTKLFLAGKCHYYGYLNNKKKPEIKGMEMKRSSSSKFEGQFQEELINKILDENTREQILDWLTTQKDKLRALPLKDIAYPCKLTSRDYLNEPIFVRAYNITKQLCKDFKVNKGELFYYIFIQPLGTLKEKTVDVMAFKEEEQFDKNKFKVDYDRVIDRSIMFKTEKIFESLNWYLLKNTEQITL